MKRAILLHNPTAGSGDHQKGELKKMVREAGYEVKYYSTDIPLWQRFTRKDADAIFVAGGDGTVQKVAAAMLEAKNEELLKVPVQVVPCGTANNIATTLNIFNAEEILKTSVTAADFDIGEVEGTEEAFFFIEGMGCGIFSRLVEVMESKEADKEQDELRQSLEELLRIVDSYEAQEAIIIADKKELTGKFLLIELMNIQLIGPNFRVAPHAEIGDGKFELVVLREGAREDLKNYISCMLAGKKTGKPLEEFAEFYRVQEVRLKWWGGDLHVDDHNLKSYKREELQVKNRKGIFQFMIP